MHPPGPTWSADNPIQQSRLRWLGIGLYAAAVALWLRLWLGLSARFDEVDAATGYLLPGDFALAGAGLACAVVGFLLHLRLL